MPHLAATFAAAVALTSASAAQQFSYDYLGEPHPLELDTTRVALQRSGVGDQNLARALGGRQGLAVVTSVEDWAITGWVMARVEADFASEEVIRSLVREIPELPEFDYASPVFLDSVGPVVIRPELLVRLEAYDEAFVSSLGEVLEADAFGVERLHHIAPDTSDGFEVLERANSLARIRGVEYAEPNMFMTAIRDYTPNDPKYGNQWALNQLSDIDMDAPEAWDITLGDANVWVAVIDDGVQQAHPDLTTVAGIDWTGNGTGGDPFNACDEHGTTVSGCIAMTVDNSLGGTGLSPDCPVIPMKTSVSNVPCDGTAMSSVTWVANALNYCRDNGIRVTSSSWGLGGPSATITTAFNSARANGVVHFAASGNDGTTSIGYPANLASVNAVMAVTANGSKASFSTTGTGIDFGAPGKGIYTTDRTGSDGYSNSNYVNVDGTSYACPYAAAVAALILSVDDTLTVDEVEAIMVASATDLGAAGYDTTFGHGMVNAHLAVVYASCLSTASATVRNAGTNPNVYTTTDPLLGQLMQFDVATAPYDFAWIVGYASPGSVTLAGGRTILVDLGSPKLFEIAGLPGPSASISVPLPTDLAFCGASFSSQAILIGGVKPFKPTNAVDCVMGAP